VSLYSGTALGVGPCAAAVGTAAGRDLLVHVSFLHRGATWARDNGCRRTGCRVSAQRAGSASLLEKLCDVGDVVQAWCVAAVRLTCYSARCVVLARTLAAVAMPVCRVPQEAWTAWGGNCHCELANGAKLAWSLVASVAALAPCADLTIYGRVCWRKVLARVHSAAC